MARDDPDLSSILPGLRPLAVPVDRLRLLERNPNVGDVPAMRRNLAEFGQRKPVVARLDAGSEPATGEVIAGNTTYKAAVEMGWTHLAVVFTDDDEMTAKAFALADNRQGELALTDEAILAELLHDIEAAGLPDLFGATGFDLADVEALDAKLSGTSTPKKDKSQSSPSKGPAFVVAFDDDAQAETWERFVNWLRAQHPDDTLGRCLSRWVADQMG